MSMLHEGRDVKHRGVQHLACVKNGRWSGYKTDYAANIVGLRRSLNSSMKQNYIESVKCMMNLPSQYQRLMYPGLKSRYDEFVVMHANATGGGSFVIFTCDPSLLVL